MGSAVCAAVAAASDLELVAAVDPAGRGSPGSAASPGWGIPLSSSVEALGPSGAEVAVDFTRRDAAMFDLEWCSANGVHAVVGTTGLDDEDLDRVGRWFDPGRGLGCIVAPNFAVGAVLMMRFAELAAPWFETAEVIELHHEAKADSPSGTAVLTAERMAATGAALGGPEPREERLVGARGALGPGGIRVHSVRLKGLVAHQEVLLGGAGQTLTLRHDSYDRSSFMPGVLAAVRAVPALPGLTVGLDAVIGLTQLERS